jgi:hypothetical protein
MAKAIDQDSGTRVEVGLTREKNIQVRVFSAMKKGLISNGYVDPKSDNVHTKVMVVAGALAEHQCANFKDRHDPDEVAQAAGEAFKVLMRKVRDGLQG